MANSYYSASRINAFIECPGAWACRYLLGLDDAPPSAAMLLGSRIEDAISCGYLPQPIDFPPLEKSDHALCDAVSRVTDVLLPRQGTHVQTEVKYDYKIGDVGYPVLGYLDFFHEELGIFELKITRKSPKNSPVMNHIRQVYLYYVGMGYMHPVTIVYGVSTKQPKCVVWTSSDEVLKALKSLDVESFWISDELMASAQEDVDHAMHCMSHHIDLYERSASLVLPLDFSHYRMSGYDKSNVLEVIEHKRRQGGSDGRCV